MRLAPVPVSMTAASADVAERRMYFREALGPVLTAQSYDAEFVSVPLTDSFDLADVPGIERLSGEYQVGFTHIDALNNETDIVVVEGTVPFDFTPPELPSGIVIRPA